MIRLLNVSFVVAFLLVFASILACSDSDGTKKEKQQSPDLKVHRISLSGSGPEAQEEAKPQGKGDQKGQKDPVEKPGKQPPNEEKHQPTSKDNGDFEDEQITEAALAFVESKLQKDGLQEARIRDICERTIRDSKQFISVVREIYAERDYAPVFVAFHNGVPVLEESGAQLKDLILDVPSHGLAPREYQIDRLEKGLAALDDSVKDFQKALEEVGGKRAKALWSLLDSFSDVPAGAQLRETLREKGFSDADLPIIRDLERFYPNAQQARKRIHEAVYLLDVSLLHGFFQFMLDFKYVRKAHPFKPTPEPTLAHVKLKDQLAEDFRKAATRYPTYVSDLFPNNPTYDGLRKGIALYQQLAESGDMDKLQVKKSLKKGSKGADVRTLSERLAIEGYLDRAAVTDKFNDEVEKALKEYQRTHQLRINGKTDTETRSSLNVSAARRLKQVELALQRWRESEINETRPAFYLRVNIPQFELEAWENNKLLRRHRVVVGSTKEETNLVKKIRGQLNFTPLMTKEMKTIVFNPYWYPPPRIQKELHAELLQAPDYLEKNNFGVRMMSDGREIIFQKSGSGNALGRVKFLFPNEHDVYLHDTPQKSYFERPVRAYSHGCMRLENPIEFAQFLLLRQNGMTKDDIKKILDKTDKESYVKLKDPVPIFVEYATVGVSDKGHLEFYIDVYKYDRAYWDQRLPVETHRDLTDTEIRTLTKDGGEMDSEEEGEDGVVPGT